MYDQLKIINKFCKLNGDNQEKIRLILTELCKPFFIKKEPIFEYSVSEDDTNFKLLHLLFYSGLTKQERGVLYRERKEQIRRIFNLFKNQNFNFILLNKILDKINDPDYPLQIAFEFNKTSLEKIKLYFSNVRRLEGNLSNTIQLIKNLLDVLKIPNKIRSGEMLGEGIDSIGIDFLNNSKIKLKIYSYYHKKFKINLIKKTITEQFQKYGVNQSRLPVFFKKISDLEYEDWGFLYRISEKGTINSVKCWFRLMEHSTLKYYNNPISYLTCDNSGLVMYFRENIFPKKQDYFFKELTEKIAATDFTGYTIQYPPIFVWKKTGKTKEIKEWVSLSTSDKLGIYINIPFCNQKCNFCRYFSKERVDTKELDKYLKYLEKEIGLYSIYFRNKKIHSLYIGGGTPSILNTTQLTNLFKIINSNFDFIDNIQKCIEINPNSTTYEKLKIMKKFGINRLTIGVQTLTEDVLKRVNRKQTKKEAIETISLAKKLGFDNINIDIMSGLPEETIISFKKTVEKIISFKPDMIHIHPFYPTPYTQFMKSGHMLSNDEMDIREKMSKLGFYILKKAGYNGIMFDAWGKKESARNIQLSDAIEHISSYIGFGPGAISHIKGELRYVNFDDVGSYYSCIDQKNLPIMRKCKITEKDEMIYYVTSCLRYGRVSEIEFYKNFKRNIYGVFRNIIEYLKNRGLMSEDEDNLYTNPKNIGEYLIYSKYFYDNNILEKARELMNYEEKKRVLSKNKFKYMLL